MTATVSEQPTVADPGAGGAGAAGGSGKAVRRPGSGVPRRVWRWCRRFHHFVIPLGIVVTLVTVTLVAHAIQTPDVTDRDYLNPSSDAAIGSHQLAQRLTTAGVHLVVTDNAGQAVSLAFGPTPVTIFVPAPDLFLVADFDGIGLLPEGTTVVLVAPGGGWLSNTGLPVRPDGGHWATVVDDPGCYLPAAAHAGPAAADHELYAGLPVADVCYGGGLIAFDIQDGPHVVVVGASDPFRNDRLTEHGNAVLATGLLGTAPTLIWLDRHKAEQPPRITGNPGNGSQAPPGTEFPGTQDGRGTGGGSGGGSGSGGGGGGGDDQNRPQSRGGLADTFPPWLWALLGLLVLAGLVIVLAAARRLGPPVGEPLPVTAYGRETLDGRGRLYRRARDPAATYDVLRRAAVEHLRTALHMPSADLDTLVDTVTALTGIDRAGVVEILVEGAPAKDAELTEAVARLDALMSAVHHATPSAEGDRR